VQSKKWEWLLKGHSVIIQECSFLLLIWYPRVCLAVKHFICWFRHYIDRLVVYLTSFFTLFFLTNFFFTYLLFIYFFRIVLCHFQTGGQKKWPNLFFVSSLGLFCDPVFVFLMHDCLWFSSFCISLGLLYYIFSVSVSPGFDFVSSLPAKRLWLGKASPEWLTGRPIMLTWTLNVGSVKMTDSACTAVCFSSSLLAAESPPRYTWCAVIIQYRMVNQWSLCVRYQLPV